MATVDQVSAFFQGYNPSGGGSEEWNMWCQAFVSRTAKTFGAFNRDYPTARAARLASGPLNPDPNSAPLGAIGYWLWNPDDHVAIHVGGGVWMMGSRHVSVQFGGVARNAGLVSFADFQARAGLQFLGWAPSNGGSTIPIEAPALASNQRRVINDGIPANGRSGASRSNPVVQTVAAGDDATFKGYVHGESINGNDIWFVGAFAGNYFHSSSFEGGANTAGLPDLAPVVTPPVVVPPTTDTNRTTLNDGSPLRVRKGAGTTYDSVRTIEPNTAVKVIGFKKGETALGTNIWFKLGENEYASAGGFTSQSTTGLNEETVTTTPPVVVPPVTTPYVPRDPEIVNPVASDFPSWIQYEEKFDANDDTATQNQSAYEYYNGKYGQDYKFYPIESHTHWWGDPSAGYSHDGVVNTFINKAEYSVHFVTSAGRITRVQPLQKVAYTTGARSMYAWTSENDPKLTEDGYKTLGFLHYLIEKKNPRLLNEQIRLHKEVVNIATGAPFATSCSNISTAKVREYAEKFRTGALDPATGKAPVTTTPPVVVPPVSDDTAKALLELRTEVSALREEVKATRAVIGSALRSAGDAID